ncbi:MAG: hypothetical protein KKC80_07925 [Candidatus Margulisbacteria bacterium]|nr:hypothetical protein [Candidatus Margulisiibacteriota bacterium]MBU1616657.1 hypothetical protein [Candidatus Margulisiibacteriota bacterium]MBU1867644.1 hypothetical protein [Candidatus Margulisiibacteriota bacterium]
MAFSEISFNSTVSDPRGQYVGKKPGSREDVRENANELGGSTTGAMGAGAKVLEGKPAVPHVVTDLSGAAHLPGEVVNQPAVSPRSSPGNIDVVGA